MSFKRNFSVQKLQPPPLLQQKLLQKLLQLQLHRLQLSKRVLLIFGGSSAKVTDTHPLPSKPTISGLELLIFMFKINCLIEFL